MHRLRRADADQASATAPVRTVRQGRGRVVLALALADGPRRDARVPPRPFVSPPINGLIYVARRRQRGGKLLI